MSRFVFDAASGNYVQQDVVSSATSNDVVNHDDCILSALAEIEKIDAMQLILDSHHDEICKIITYLGEETEDEDFENNN